MVTVALSGFTRRTSVPNPTAWGVAAVVSCVRDGVTGGVYVPVGGAGTGGANAGSSLGSPAGKRKSVSRSFNVVPGRR